MFGGQLKIGTLALALPLFLLAFATPVSAAGDGLMSFKSKRVICECGARIVESGQQAALTTLIFL